MKKIRLDLESLKVESFVTNRPSGAREGTVYGMGANTYCDWTCNEVTPSCNGDPGCISDVDDTCDWTYPQATTCTSPYGTTTGGETEDWTCEPCAASCNSEGCKTD